MVQNQIGRKGLLMAVVFEEFPSVKMVRVCICDKCGMRVDYTNKCFGCGKDICMVCQPDMNHWIDPLDCDEFAYEYCDKCWIVGTKYRDEIGISQSNIMVAQDSWNEDCKK